MKHTFQTGARLIDRETHWIEKAKQGNHRAFNRLVRKYRDPMYLLAFNLCGNADDAADIVQDVFLKLFNSLQQFRQDAAFSTWLYRVTVNRTRDFLRKQTRHRHQELNEAMLISNPPPMNSGPDDAMQQALNQLSLQQREVVVLKYYENLSYQEIAAVLQCSQSTIRNQMMRALKKMRILLKQPA